MNIQPTAAAASVAGTGRGVARGGETEKRATIAASQQADADKPAGKTSGASAVDEGEKTGDRGGDGRQLYDDFESHEEHREEAKDESPAQPASPPSQPGTGEHLDLEI